MRLTVILISLLFSIPTLYAQLPNNVPTQGLIAWWGFDGNTNDQSGHGHDLINTGGASGAFLIADRNGNPNSAYSFDGLNNHMFIYSPSFQMSDVSSFTLSVWAKKDDSSHGVFVEHGSNTTNKFAYKIQANNTTASFATTASGSPWISANTSYSLNTWEHYVGVYQNKTMKFYKNGVLVDTATFNYTNVISSSIPFYVGRGSNFEMHKGSLDDIGLWSRALTPTEIVQLYNDSSNVSVSLFEDESANVTTYPNPANDNLKIKVSSEWTGAAYKIVDISGKTIISGVVNEEITSLDISNLVKGIYVLQLQGESTLQKKIMVM